MESIPKGRSEARRPTIHDVALEARVGLGTASRALTGSGRVSPEARARVAAAIKRLGFEPSPAARALRRGRTQTIGVLIPFFTRHYFLEILRGIEEATSERDYALIIYDVEQPEQAKAHLRFLTRTHRVDALIVVALDGTLLAPALRATGHTLPIVAVDTTIRGAPAIDVDYEGGVYAVVQHLLARGHRRIALIDRAADPVTNATTLRRRSGYERALREAGVRISPSLVVVADYSPEAGRIAAASLIKSKHPTALACASDLQALGAMDAVRQAGLSVPGDVAVTGFHDVEIAGYVGLTTVRVSMREMGRTAIDFALSLLEGRGDTPACQLVSTELVVRSTS